MSKLNIIPCLTWIKRGVSKEVPHKIELNKDDLKRLIDEAKTHVLPEQNDEEMSVTSNTSDSDADNEANDDIVSKYGLDEYDDDDDGELGDSSLRNLANLTVFASNQDDPYLEDNDDDSEENENFRIKESDNMVLVGHVERDAAILEVQGL